MTELLPPADGPVRLTPRQDRIERTLGRLLRRRATRSELREAVYQYADLHRLQGMAPERAVGALKAVVRGALAVQRPRPVGEEEEEERSGLPADLMPMIVRWYTTRFHRGSAVASLGDAVVELAP